MDDNKLIKNSSLFVAYMGCLGWGSAYFYGWGISFYYGYPWWVVSAGMDDVARSLLYAVTVMGIFLLGWGIGLAFFISVKQRSNMQELSFTRLFLAIFLLFTPVIIEFSILKQDIAIKLTVFSVIVAAAITFVVRGYGHLFSFAFILQNKFLRKHRVEFNMAWFLVYFWMFSLVVGWYKPQFRKEYEMVRYKNEWHYILARYNNNLVLSKSFRSGSRRFIIFSPEKNSAYEINSVKSRL